MMNWTYSIRNKMVASAALFTLCLLVLFSNYSDREHSSNVKRSISTLYEDRLVVEDYILKMTVAIYEIKQALSTVGQPDDQSAEKIKALLAHLDGLSAAYQKTKLTQKEDVTFTALLKTISELRSPSSQAIDEQQNLADQALGQLNELSSIQLEESKLIMKQAEELYMSGKAASQFAFGITIVILLVLQALVFTSKPSGDPDQSDLSSSLKH